MANKDNNLKLNSSGKGNKKVSPRISPMTLGEFQITPKLSQGARKKGRKSDPTSIDGKSTDKENSKKKATFVTVERPNSGASPELTSSSQSKNESPKKKATLITLERTNLDASGRYELTSGSETKSDTKGSLSYHLCFQYFPQQFKIDSEL